MMFVGQIPIPGEPVTLAYLFVTDDPQCMAETFDAEAGENALLVQPSGRIPPLIVTTDRGTGPSLWRRGMTWDEHVRVEYAVDLVPPDPAAEATLDADIARQEAERAGVLLDLPEAVDVHTSALPPCSYVGARPTYGSPISREYRPTGGFTSNLTVEKATDPMPPTPSTSVEGPDTVSSLRTSAKAASSGTASDA